MKLFNRDEFGALYPISWEHGYIRLEFDWRQLLYPTRFNWITIRFADINFEVSRHLYQSFEFTFVLLGIGIYFQHIFDVDEELKRGIQEEWENAEPCPTCGVTTIYGKKG